MTDEVEAVEDAGGAAAPTGTRYGRRLSDNILVAFHHACDQDDLEIADGLLRLLERLVERKPVPPDVDRRRDAEPLVAAHERFWLMRRPELDR